MKYGISRSLPRQYTGAPGFCSAGRYLTSSFRCAALMTNAGSTAMPYRISPSTYSSSGVPAREIFSSSRSFLVSRSVQPPAESACWSTGNPGQSLRRDRDRPRKPDNKRVRGQGVFEPEETCTIISITRSHDLFDLLPRRNERSGAPDFAWIQRSPVTTPSTPPGPQEQEAFLDKKRGERGLGVVHGKMPLDILLEPFTRRHRAFGRAARSPHRNRRVQGFQKSPHASRRAGGHDAPGPGRMPMIRHPQFQGRRAHSRTV